MKWTFRMAPMILVPCRQSRIPLIICGSAKRCSE